MKNWQKTKGLRNIRDNNFFIEINNILNNNINLYLANILTHSQKWWLL